VSKIFISLRVFSARSFFILRYSVVVEALRENEMQTNTNCTSQKGFHHFQINGIGVHSK